MTKTTSILGKTKAQAFKEITEDDEENIGLNLTSDFGNRGMQSSKQLRLASFKESIREENKENFKHSNNLQPQKDQLISDPSSKRQQPAPSWIKAMGLNQQAPKQESSEGLQLKINMKANSNVFINMGSQLRPNEEHSSKAKPQRKARASEDSSDEEEINDLRRLVKGAAGEQQVAKPRTDLASEGQEKRSLNPDFMFQPLNLEEGKGANMAMLPAIRADREYTLVLDLDETLIHYDSEKKLFFIRPFTRHFLRTLANYYEIVIFTAATQDYTDYILDKVDIENTISHKLSRQHTRLVQGCYLKDLGLLGRDLSKTLIVDNNPLSFQLHPSNGVYIKTWHNDPEDKALLRLGSILQGTYCFSRHRREEVFGCEGGDEEAAREDAEAIR